MRERILIECQTCGTVMYEVFDPALRQRIAANPQNYIYDCNLHDPYTNEPTADRKDNA